MNRINFSLVTNTQKTTQVMPTLRKIEVSQQAQDQVDPVVTSLEALISESFTCLICAGPCRETIVLPTCNHRFCNICINEYLRYEHVCPYNNCNAQIPKSGSLRRDPQFDQIIESVQKIKTSVEQNPARPREFGVKSRRPTKHSDNSCPGVEEKITNGDRSNKKIDASTNSSSFTPTDSSIDASIDASIESYIDESTAEKKNTPKRESSKLTVKNENTSKRESSKLTVKNENTSKRESSKLPVKNENTSKLENSKATVKNENTSKLESSKSSPSLFLQNRSARTFTSSPLTRRRVNVPRSPVLSREKKAKRKNAQKAWISRKRYSVPDLQV